MTAPNTLTLTIDLDNCETADGGGKFEGFTFLNNLPENGGRYKAIQATDADGNVWHLKTVMLKPKAPKKSGPASDSKTAATNSLADAVKSLTGIVGSLAKDVASLKESLPLKSGRKGIAAPALQATIGANVAAKGTNGVAKV